MRLTAITTDLCRLQSVMSAMNPFALHWLAYCFRRTPDGFSREMKADHANSLRQAVAVRTALQQMLPREAANDTHQSSPGAA